MKRTALLLLAATLLALPAVLLLEQIADALLVQVVLLVTVAASLIVCGIVMRPVKQLALFCDPFALQCLFLVQFFIIGPIAVVAFGLGLSHLAFARPVQPTTPLVVLAAFCLMLAAMIVGYQQRLGEIVASHLPVFARSSRKLPGLWIEIASVIVCVAGCIAWVEYQGGLIARFSQAYGVFVQGSAIFLLFQNGIVVATMLVAWRLMHAPKRSRAGVAFFGGLMAFNLVYFGIVFGVRKYLLYLFFGLVAMMMLRKGAGAVSKVKIAGTLALLLVFFSVWGAIRHRPVLELIGGTGADPRRIQSQDAGIAFFQSMADPFSTVCMIWEIFPQAEPFRYGQTLLVTLLGPIPRALWPGKPVGMGKEITRYFVGPFFDPTQGLSLAPTMLGDFYVNLGWPGIILGGLLMGVACRVVAVYAVTGMRGGLQTRPARVLFPALFLMGLGEVRGEMASMLAFWGMTYVPLIASLAFFNLDYGGAAESAAAGEPAPAGIGDTGGGNSELGPALGGHGTAQSPAGPAIR